ncbi:DNA repair protein [Lentinula raphanica]|nr:DNA repair protein [Lentinula raphanica]
MHASLNRHKKPAYPNFRQKLTNFNTNLDAEKIVNQHIKLLHRYNEAKDATQILIGRLANLKEITVRQIHKDLELPIGD